jgi:hypothetical protein
MFKLSITTKPWHIGARAIDRTCHIIIEIFFVKVRVISQDKEAGKTTVLFLEDVPSVGPLDITVYDPPRYRKHETLTVPSGTEAYDTPGDLKESFDRIWNGAKLKKPLEPGDVIVTRKEKYSPYLQGYLIVKTAERSIAAIDMSNWREIPMDSADWHSRIIGEKECYIIRNDGALEIENGNLALCLPLK